MATGIIEHSIIAKHSLLVLEITLVALLSSMAYLIKRTVNAMNNDISQLNAQLDLLTPKVITLYEKSNAHENYIEELQSNLKNLTSETISNQKELAERVTTYNDNTAKELQKVHSQLGKIVGFLEASKKS